MKKGRIVVGGVLAFGVMARMAAGQEAAGAKPAQVAPIVVQEEKQMQEETVVGPYDQPEWSTHRRFPLSRIYLQHTPYEMGVEQWWRLQHFRDGTTKQRFQEEFGIGLPHRIQLDIYETWVVKNDGHTVHDNVAAEIRYALADWGKIPMNPTIYLEWKFVKGGADVLESKLLLGDELASGVHWGVNLVYEQEVSDVRTTEYAVSGAIGKTIIDQKLGLGIEAKYINATEKGSRSDAEQQFLLGPSLQWRPAPRWHVDLAPLAGLTDDSPRVEAWAVAGFEFGPGPQKKSVQAPISTIRN